MYDILNNIIHKIQRVNISILFMYSEEVASLYDNSAHSFMIFTNYYKAVFFETL